MANEFTNPQSLKQMSNETVRENMRMYARVVNSPFFNADDLDSLIRYGMEYQSRMGW